MKIFLLFVFLTSALFSQTVTIDAGGPTDTGFSSPAPTTAYTIPVPVTGSPDITMRYGQNFTYTLTVPIGGMYLVQLNFIEPCGAAVPCSQFSGAGSRIFSVWANDQPVIQNLDIAAEVGSLVPMTKTALIYIAGNVKLAFVASVRNAIISSISVMNLNVGNSTTNCCIPPSLTWQTDIFPTVTLPLNITVNMAGGTTVSGGQIFPLTYVPAGVGPVLIFRNGLAQKSTSDFTITGQSLQFSTPIVAGDNIEAVYRH